MSVSSCGRNSGVQKRHLAGVEGLDWLLVVLQVLILDMELQAHSSASGELRFKLIFSLYKISFFLNCNSVCLSQLLQYWQKY